MHGNLVKHMCKESKKKEKWQINKMHLHVRPKKNICLFKLSCQNKIGSVGRKIFLFFKIFF